MNRLYPLFLDNIRRHHLIQPGDTILLGFSGGKDSVTLFQLLRRLQADISFGLILVYFNHSLREDSAAEERWVRDFCQKHGVELVVGCKNVMEFKTRAGLNLEHAASLSRYRFFQEVARRFPGAKTATAHTQSDLTETFLIKLFRGSGLQGLGAIYHKKENTIIRPLLLFPQEEVYDFLARNGFDYYTDPTNAGDQFLRNKIRNDLVPRMLAIEPHLHERVFRTVSIVQDEYDFFSETALRILNESLILGKVLPTFCFRDRHVALQRHIVREYLRLLKGNLLNVDYSHIETLRTVHLEQKGLAVPGVELMCQKGFVFPIDFSIPSYGYEIPGEGRFYLPEIDSTLVAEVVSRYEKPVDNHHIIVPVAMLRFPLTVRNVVSGDKYIKINTSIRQKVFEAIRASGLPAPLRYLAPVICNGGDGADILWVKGAPVADWAKVTHATEQKAGPYFKLSFAHGHAHGRGVLN